ncbi:phosphotransferase family protein [Streptomyces litchfieldiae]|uniref:Aminoglycoside phosphotransferase family protein n=1 Tax=Streptomyces litchfieldiae TaxID=3075543 RepID=A0ABU2MZ75_9ACTN|nr:aminoglycoside phosphotransferase family protein [Streptomyces sp. DSM 44938]MDT0346935.1 aminoglycoside phosphotransferase family protein [Streptomyces sp. DSM 44938]
MTESITKNRQSPRTLRAMIERAYGAEQAPDGDDFAEEITHGWFNVAYRIRLRDGQRVVLKIAPPAHVAVLTRERDMMRNELAAMALVREHTQVPIPRVDHADLSRELVDADYFFMEYVDADNFGIATSEGRLPAEVVTAGGRQLGALNRELNSIVGPHFGPLRGPGSATWRAAFGQLVEDTLVDGERVSVDIGRSYDEIRATVAAHASVLDDVTEPRFVEVDLWTKNSMIRDGQIVAILDHERAIYGDPIMEAGFTGIDLPVFGEPTDFIRGYGRGELSESERVRRRLYSLYLAVIMIVETKYRGHRDTATYDFGREQLDLLMAQFGRSPARC